MRTVKRGGIVVGAALALALMWSCDSPSEPDITPAQLSISAGDDQTATAGTAVAIPPAITVANAAGTPLQGVAVSFSVTTGGGSVTGANATTDDQGVAAVESWTLGTAVGANELTAVASGLSVTFSATGELDTIPFLVIPTKGFDQNATAGTEVAIPPEVTVVNATGTPIPGVAVTFSVTDGDGSVTGENATTDDQGVAAVGSWTLGTTAGDNELTASVIVEGPVAPITLTATFTAFGTSPPLEGVFLFDFKNLQGIQGYVSRDISDLKNLPGPCGVLGGDWDDCISSIALSEGWVAILYEFDGFGGDSLIVVTNIFDLDNVGGGTGWDNRASSIRVRPPN
jgi:hypothetical protein